MPCASQLAAWGEVSRIVLRRLREVQIATPLQWLRIDYVRGRGDARAHPLRLHTLLSQASLGNAHAATTLSDGQQAERGGRGRREHGPRLMPWASRTQQMEPWTGFLFTSCWPESHGAGGA
jgi:hypothetical protein